MKSFRPTRTGLGCALAGLLTILSALSTGNNLLYILYSQLVALFLISWYFGRRNLRDVRISALDAPGATRGRTASYPLRLVNHGDAARFNLDVRGTAVPRLEAGSARDVSVRLSLPHRGLNRLGDLAVESEFPFALWRHRENASAPVLLAVPEAPRAGLGELESLGETRDGAGGTTGGPGDEFYGARHYDSGDDPRKVNWKLTARTGNVFVNEYRAPGGGRRTVRLAPSRDVELAITAAAAACRAGIEDGAEVRLLTPGREVPYGRGPGHLQKLLEALALVGEGARPREARTASEAPVSAENDAALRWVTRLGGIWVFASLFLIEELNGAPLFALTPLLLAGLWLERRGGPWLSKRAGDAFSTIVLAFGLFADWRLAGVTVATSHLVAYVLLNRSLTEPDGRHGLTFLAHFLAFFLVSGQTISLGYFVFFLGYGAYAATWLAFAHGARWSDRESWRRPVTRLWLASLAAGVVIFLVTPRVEPRGQLNPAAAMGLDRLKTEAPSVAGFTENVALGYFGTVKRSTVKALRVAPYPPPVSPMPIYVRGNAYESFDGHSWTKAPALFLYKNGDRVFRAANGRAWGLRQGPLLRFGPPTGRERAYDITVFPLNTSVIFSVGSLRAVQEDSSVDAFMDHLDSGYFSVPYATGVRYRAYADPDAGAIWPSIIDTQTLHRRFLQLPAGLDRRVNALAQKLAGKSATDADRVWAIRDHLREHYGYSTFARDGRANLEEFLFKTKRGNCEYFATAAAILLRQVGVPTRLVTGFHVSEWNEYGRFYDVRQSQAHAWTEALVNGRWITVDATPGDESLLGTFGDWYNKYVDALEARWYSNVIGYDRFAQRNTFYHVRQDLLRIPSVDRKTLALLAAAGGILWFLWWLAHRKPRDRGLFARAERLCERVGLARAPHVTPLEFARAARARTPALAPLEDLARLHYRDRFGPGLSANERARAESLLQDIGAVVK
ncbi:MAG: DUF3488 domain-containing protein [Elusimicrobia bacterium]|nr:DUF3488 domain-containing protein [Elusimicrobiota bacterium]